MLAGQPPIAFLATRDPVRAWAFYRDTLALPLTGEDAFALVFDVGGVMLRVVTVPEVVAAPYTVLGWAVPDIDAAAAALVRAGVVLERYTGLMQDTRGVWEAPSGARIVWFKDPDHSVLALTQVAAAPPVDLA